ncbi:hypothetical protein BCR42DRAFT_399345 [Absidia repens]|uniref:Uncharacterized protein n=1 Tax=Absidia repens TaxID=90262 RepID=A0A1X2IZR6_9FUNG|nr:hypothetical protein BCR42DRAFT_399345 [Absidia repens]
MPYPNTTQVFMVLEFNLPTWRPFSSNSNNILVWVVYLSPVGTPILLLLMLLLWEITNLLLLLLPPPLLLMVMPILMPPPLVNL